MAGSSLLALLDDIATILDDIALMSKVAAQKTAGVLGDDLALNAQQVAGVQADRELPVVWAVAKGSLRNKCILVPAALAISALIPWAIIPLLMLGGLYLSFEGFEKLAHKFLHGDDEDKQHHEQQIHALVADQVDMVAFEREKIKGAIRTDFILSAEIIVIALGIVADATFTKQIIVLTFIAFIMTLGVYGLVGAIVKLDDVGLYLVRSETSGTTLKKRIGELILRTAPIMMKAISVIGMAAMFVVGGGILIHGIPALHHIIGDITSTLATIRFVGAILGVLAPIILNAASGIIAGAITLGIVVTIDKLWPVAKPAD